MKKIEYLDIPQVAKMLTGNEKKVIRASAAKPLLEAEDFEIVEVLDRAALMTGTAWSKTPDDLRRVMNFIRDMYGNLTTDDFVNAFMFICAGEVDAYLPSDRNGQPDRNSYGAFNEAYIGKVLRAYSLYSLQVWRKVNYYMPKTQTEINMSVDVDKVKMSRDEDVMNAYNTWLRTGELGCSSVMIPFIYQVLHGLGFVQGQKATAGDVANALMGGKSEWKKNEIKRAFMQIKAQNVNLKDKLKEL